MLEGRVAPSDKAPLVNAASVPTDVQINYVAGGGAANLPVRVSALVRGKTIAFGDYEMFGFSPPRKQDAGATNADEDSNAAQDARVVADKLPLTLDRNGAGKLTIDKLPKNAAPRELLLEATYADPNGEVQTIRSTQTLWPAAVVAGLRTEGWVSTSQKLKFQALALDLAGKPLADVPLDVKAVARITTSSRKRMVGGFYTYDNKTETKDLGTVCSGKSDKRGLLLCESALKEAGEVELVVSAKDTAGNTSLAASSVYVTKQGELWFGGEDNDRIDVLPEKKSYQPGEVAKFQVRSPFRFATALVSVEREGIIETHVVQLNGQDPTVSLQVKPEWGPNAYVSVMALRGRLRDVPWYSFFTWGFKAPREWWTAFWYEGKEYVAPTALVDLSKPAYRLGLAEIRVGSRAHQLEVKRGQRQARLHRAQPGTASPSPASCPTASPPPAPKWRWPRSTRRLLELMPNSSWNLLDAMLQRRSWGVSTSTAQMEIVGRRHYGRKAVPAGGGGGKSPRRASCSTHCCCGTRRSCSTPTARPPSPCRSTTRSRPSASSPWPTCRHRLVRYRPDQHPGHAGPADHQRPAAAGARGRPVPRADHAAQHHAEGDEGRSQAPRATLLTLEPQTVDIPAGEAREVAWMVTAPAQLGADARRGASCGRSRPGTRSAARATR